MLISDSSASALSTAVSVYSFTVTYISVALSSSIPVWVAIAGGCCEFPAATAIKTVPTIISQNSRWNWSSASIRYWREESAGSWLVSMGLVVVEEADSIKPKLFLIQLAWAIYWIKILIVVEIVSLYSKAIYQQRILVEDYSLTPVHFRKKQCENWDFHQALAFYFPIQLFLCLNCAFLISFPRRETSNFAWFH